MNPPDLFLNFIINLLAGIVGILVVLWIERQRRPRIFMDVGKHNEIGPNDPLGRSPAKWLYVQIHNKGMPRWLAWVYNRESAQSCRAWITFYHLDGNRVYDREMHARWSETPEPNVVVTEVSGNRTQADHPTAAPKDLMTIGGSSDRPCFVRLVNVQETIDIPPGEHAKVDVVFRMADEDDCYGWCNDSYLYNWKHPGWRLEKGRYIAKVRVKTGGKEWVDTFLVENSVPYGDFRLVHDQGQMKHLRY